MSVRITEADLTKQADDLSKLTGQEFTVNFPNRRPTLFVKSGRGVNTCFSDDTHGGLMEQMVRFEAGINYGLNMAKEVKNPDLAEPIEALDRIYKELVVLSHKTAKDGDNYPDGYYRSVDRASSAVVAAKDYATED